MKMITNTRNLMAAVMLSVCTLTANGQNNEIKSDRIASLQVVAGDDWLSPPVMILGGDEPITIRLTT